MSVQQDTASDEGLTVARRGHLPFAQVSVEILRNPALSINARMLYALLATYADTQSRETFISRRTLSEAMGLHPDNGIRSISRWAAELVEAGLLSVSARQRENNAQSSNTYMLMDVSMIRPKGTRAERRAAYAAAPGDAPF